MTTTQAIEFIKARYPKACLQRWGKRWTLSNVMGEAIDFRGKLSCYIRPERCWKKLAMRIKRRESR